MRTRRLTSLPLAALAAAALASPASAVSADAVPGPPTWPEDPRPVTEQVVTPKPAGPPTWPVDPKPITPGPAAVADRSDGIDPGTVGIGTGLVATLALAAAGGVTVRRRRRTGSIRLS